MPTVHHTLVVLNELKIIQPTATAKVWLCGLHYRLIQTSLWRIKGTGYFGLDWTSRGHVVVKIGRSPCSKQHQLQRQNWLWHSATWWSFIAKGDAILQGQCFFSLCGGELLALPHHSQKEKLLPITWSKHLLGKCVSCPFLYIPL